MGVEWVAQMWSKCAVCSEGLHQHDPAEVAINSLVPAAHRPIHGPSSPNGSLTACHSIHRSLSLLLACLAHGITLAISTTS